MRLGLLLLLSTQSFAAEVDSFTHRTSSLRNARNPLNEQVRSAFRGAATGATRTSRGECSADVLRSELRLRLGSPLPVGQPEIGILLSSDFPVVVETMAQSVFRNFPVLEFPHMWAVGVTLAYLMRFDSHFIGTDKLGHFFDQGWTYFQMIHSEGKSLQEALAWGIESERGIFGLQMNGIFSWSDLVVNYQGLRFWEDVPHRYYSCSRGVWTQTRPFDFADYVDAGWDEGVNCAEYRSESLRLGVEREIRRLERARGEPLQCPIRPAQCHALRERYGQLGDSVLSPACERRSSLDVASH
jgi:hypothetical protein